MMSLHFDYTLLSSDIRITFEDNKNNTVDYYNAATGFYQFTGDLGVQVN